MTPRRLLAETPDDASAWERLGAALRAENRLPEALSALLRAAAMKPAGQDLHAAIADVCVFLPSPDIDRAAWASHRLRPGHVAIATHWRHAAEMLERTGHADLAYAAAWEALRLAGAGRSDPLFDSSRRLADVDFAPSTSEDAMTTLGYSLIPGVVDAARVANFRRRVTDLRIDDPTRKGEPPPNIFEQVPELVDLVLQPSILAPLRRWAGDRPLLSPLATAAPGLFTSWHTDTARMAGGGRSFNEGRRTLTLTMLIYLQENRPFVGGGLDVAPGTHREMGERLRGAPRTIASQPGDVVIFDSRIAHRGSKQLIAGISPQPKIFFSMQWGVDPAYAREAVAAYVGVAPPVTPALLATLTRKCEAAGVGVIAPPGY